jgi:hypothetical protein
VWDYLFHVVVCFFAYPFHDAVYTADDRYVDYGMSFDRPCTCASLVGLFIDRVEHARAALFAPQPRCTMALTLVLFFWLRSADSSLVSRVYDFVRIWSLYMLSMYSFFVSHHWSYIFVAVADVKVCSIAEDFKSSCLEEVEIDDSAWRSSFHFLS